MVGRQKKKHAVHEARPALVCHVFLISKHTAPYRTATSYEAAIMTRHGGRTRQHQQVSTTRACGGTKQPHPIFLPCPTGETPQDKNLNPNHGVCFMLRPHFALLVLVSFCLGRAGQGKARLGGRPAVHRRPACLPASRLYRTEITLVGRQPTQHEHLTVELYTKKLALPCGSIRPTRHLTSFSSSPKRTGATRR